MRQDDRAALEEALSRARPTAYPDGEYVGQESFMSASEIRLLAVQAGIRAGTSVLDVCCGVAGPGRLITAELGCDYLGVDASASAVALARQRAGDLSCRFEVAQVPPVPAGPFDVVLLLETLLAFPDKDTLLRGIASALHPGGRFGLTVEEGMPLTSTEQAAMPHADTVSLVPLPRLMSSLQSAGLDVQWRAECSLAHRARADALAQAFLADRRSIRKRLGGRVLDDLVTSHRLWSEWLGSGRVRKFALVAAKTGESSHE
ncbi:MAG: class I SAM-dependent methyltransferase [Nocardioides sp.]